MKISKNIRVLFIGSLLLSCAPAGAIKQGTSDLMTGLTAASTLGFFTMAYMDDCSRRWNNNDGDLGILATGCIFAAAAASLVRYVSNKYTPQGKLSWARKIQERIEQDNFINSFRDNDFESEQKLETHINKRYIRSNWPIISAFKYLNSRYNSVITALDCLDGVQQDFNYGDIGFRERYTELYKMLREQKEFLEEIILAIKAIPSFHNHLAEYEKLELERETVALRRQAVMAQLLNTHSY